jgi:hypothetical protein
MFAGVLGLGASVSGQQPTDQARQAREAFLNGGILTLSEEFGRALFSRCVFTVFYYRPPLLNGTDRLELNCTPNIRPRLDDVVATRRLTAEEVETVATLAVASDLYSGGHTGFSAAAGSEGPFERLEVGRCCGREDQVILITTGNPTFSTGERAKLLNLLHEWRRPLVTDLMNRKLR